MTRNRKLRLGVLLFAVLLGFTLSLPSFALASDEAAGQNGAQEAAVSSNSATATEESVNPNSSDASDAAASGASAAFGAETNEDAQATPDTASQQDSAVSDAPDNQNAVKSDNPETVDMASGVSAGSYTVTYRTHMQNIGWQDWVSDGVTAGKPDQGLRLEALQLQLKDGSGNVVPGVRYAAHVQDIGWQDWVSDGATAGTTGQSKRVEAVKISLTEDLEANYSIRYRVYVQGKGWTDWASDGEVAGTTGQQLRAEAIEVKIVAKTTATGVTAQARVQDLGWMDWVGDNEPAGTTGKGLRMEALRLKVNGESGGITYRAHVQNIGWQDWVSDGAIAGTEDQQLRVEAIQVKLTGQIAQDYDVYYRAHVKDFGWLAWAKNGESAGSSGLGLRVEAVQVTLVKKGAAAPSNDGASTAYLATSSVTYKTHVQNIGWQDWVSDGATAGTTGQQLRVEAMQLKLVSNGISGGIEYSAHVQNIGWQDWVSDGATAGTTGQQLRVEGVRIRLTGDAANYFDVYYRVHVQDIGWMGWAKNGESAGTQGRSLRVEAVQVVIVCKGNSAPGSTDDHFLSGSLIYLDAGHGLSGAYGYDSGAVGSGYTEAKETAELVTKVANYARSLYGLNVYSNVNCNVDFRDRQAHAASMHATSYVAIHFNDSESGATGTESYIFRAYDRWKGVAAPGSKTIQHIMHTQLVGALGLTDRGELTDAFAVTNGEKTGIPATLLEVCFISNPYDMRVYKAREDAVARALAAGLKQVVQAGY